MALSIAKPIQTLQQLVTSLEAALSVNLADPDRKAVHELRSETRRIEAQLELLHMVRGLPPYKTEAESLLRRLARLRRLAGKVRDCDVQRKLLGARRDDGTVGDDAEATAELRKDSDR